jgi:ribosomal-protein-alanine N-acetyltransferase
MATTERALRTERLIGRPLAEGDADDLRVMHADAKTMATLGGRRTTAESADWLERNLDQWAKHDHGIWIFRDQQGRFAGRAGLRWIEVEGLPEIELGYALLADCWGRGLGTEMAGKVLSAERERVRPASVIALIDPANRPSLRVGEKLGFLFERDVKWSGSLAGMFRLRAGI